MVIARDRLASAEASRMVRPSWNYLGHAPRNEIVVFQSLYMAKSVCEKLMAEKNLLASKSTRTSPMTRKQKFSGVSRPNYLTKPSQTCAETANPCCDGGMLQDNCQTSKFPTVWNVAAIRSRGHGIR